VDDVTALALAARYGNRVAPSDFVGDAWVVAGPDERPVRP
jgi:hypothetical protein